MRATTERDQVRIVRAESELVILIDQRHLTRAMIAALLRSGLPGSMVFDAAGAAEPGLEDIENPSLAVVNIHSHSITDPPVVAALDGLRRRFAATPVVVLSRRECAAQAAQAMRAGVRGYIPASADTELLLAALRLVRAGGTFAAPLPTGMEAVSTGIPTGPGARMDDIGRTEPRLTAREEEVLARLREGKANKIIAFELGLSENTVKVHVRRIIRKLNVTNRTEAAFMDGGGVGVGA